MANYLTTDTDLTAVANAIRTKGGTSAPLTFPAGFVSAVEAIETGGGGGEWTSEGIATNTEPNGIVNLGSTTTVEWYAFAYKPLTRLQSGSVTQLESYALFKSGITRIEPKDMPVLYGVGASTFQDCGNLEYVHIPSLTANTQWRQINSVFRGCTSLKALRIPSFSVSLGGDSIRGCLALEIADLGLTPQIQTNMMFDCKKIQKIILRKRDGVATLANVSAFSNTPFRGYDSLTGTVYVPAELIDDYKAATNWATIYAEGHCNFVALEGSPYEDTDWEDEA